MKIAVLGYSVAALTMIFDILESGHEISEIIVINNLKIKEEKPAYSSIVAYRILEDIPVNFNGKYIVGTINVENKKKIIDGYKISLEFFISISHSSVILSNTTFLGKGCILNGGTIIAGQTRIGNFVYLNRKVSVGHHTQIGDFTTINPGCNIAGNVTIGEGCQIGMGANIIDGVTIGKNCIIGAGSLVLKDIPDQSVAYGNPCKIIRENKFLEPGVSHTV